jgi:hypothetical protein
VLALVSCEQYDPKNFLSTGEPVRLVRLRIRATNNETLWEIERANSTAAPEAVLYGETPYGFRQTTPVRGRPRLLRKGEGLAVLRVTEKSATCHRGIALGPDEFRGGGWSSIPIEHPKNREAAVAFAEIMECSESP